ncbi:uncharacterized protein BKA78DRAFT_291914 [Phyllosticta capitalensis]|uniref:uncharacterized protein n=1 Tax=Phyllosticta capitalensis TaxID=121624 RepID=UPI00313048DA
MAVAVPPSLFMTASSSLSHHRHHVSPNSQKYDAHQLCPLHTSHSVITRDDIGRIILSNPTVIIDGFHKISRIAPKQTPGLQQQLARWRLTIDSSLLISIPPAVVPPENNKQILPEVPLSTIPPNQGESNRIIETAPGEEAKSLGPAANAARPPLSRAQGPPIPETTPLAMATPEPLNALSVLLSALSSVTVSYQTYFEPSPTLQISGLATATTTVTVSEFPTSSIQSVVNSIISNALGSATGQPSVPSVSIASTGAFVAFVAASIAFKSVAFASIAAAVDKYPADNHLAATDNSCAANSPAKLHASSHAVVFAKHRHHSADDAASLQHVTSHFAANAIFDFANGNLDQQ